MSVGERGTGVGGPSAGNVSAWTDAALSDDTGVPLYIQIRNLLRERIRLGEWAADEPMPTEEELVVHFGVSRTTVRQAMGDLANEGLVVRHAGRGTFARQPLMVVRMQQWHSLTTDITRRGLEPSKKTVLVEKLDARAEIAHRASELAEGDILHIRSVRYADGIPIVVLDNYFPFELCGFLTEVELDAPDNSIEHSLAEHGIELARANGEFSAAVATREEAKHLDIKPGTPVVEIAMKSYDAAGRVVEYSRALVVSERYPLAMYSDWSVEPAATPH